MAAQAHRLHEKEISWWLCQMVRDWGHSTQKSRPANQGGQVLESICPWRLAGYLKRWWNKNQTDIYHLVDLQLLILIQLYWNVFSLQRMNNHTKTTHHHTGGCVESCCFMDSYLGMDFSGWRFLPPVSEWTTQIISWIYLCRVLVRPKTCFMSFMASWWWWEIESWQGGKLVSKHHKSWCFKTNFLTP